MSVDTDVEDLTMKYMMSKGQIEAEIDKLLGTHKNAVFRGFSQNYLDYEVHYVDWKINKLASFVLREGRNDKNNRKEIKPHWMKWKEELHALFIPIRKYMDTETKKHEKTKMML